MSMTHRCRLKPALGKTKTGRLWTRAFARAGSTFATSGHFQVPVPAGGAVLPFTRSQKPALAKAGDEHPQAHLKEFRGIIHVDAYVVNELGRCSPVDA